MKGMKRFVAVRSLSPGRSVALAGKGRGYMLDAIHSRARRGAHEPQAR
jgi:hypothetical protein